MGMKPGRLVVSKPVLTKKCGVWVYQGEPCDLSIAELIDREREKRLRGLGCMTAPQ